jgi:glutamate 5-kinase
MLTKLQAARMATACDAVIIARGRTDVLLRLASASSQDTFLPTARLRAATLDVAGLSVKENRDR